MSFHFITENIFITESGSNKNLKKIIIVITDGRIFMDNMTLTEVLQNPKINNITRIAIGVSVLYQKKEISKAIVKYICIWIWYVMDVHNLLSHRLGQMYFGMM